MVVSSIAEAKKFPVARIREELAALGLSKEGLKPVIMLRLISHLEAQQQAASQDNDAPKEPTEDPAAAAKETKAETPGDATVTTKTPVEEPATEKGDPPGAEEPEETPQTPSQEEPAEAGKSETETVEPPAVVDAEKADVATEEPTEMVTAVDTPATSTPEESATAMAEDCDEATVKETAVESSEETAVKSESAANTSATEDSEANTNAAEDSKADANATEDSKAAAGTEVEPPSPASVGGGNGDGPPSKKAKTENGSSASKKVKVSGDPSGREIFIEGVPEAATNDDVKKVAEEHGAVAALRVLRTDEEPPKCKGLALVRYNDRESARKALEGVPSQKIGESALTARASSNSNTLFIGNLNKMWDKESVLKAFMETVEGVVNFELTIDALNNRQNRGFGFVTFDTVEACKAAHAKYYKDKLSIMDNQVLIDWAETRGSRQDDERGVYVLNVDENVEDTAFKAHFEKHGTVEKIVYGRLIPHARRKDFAIVNFLTRESAKSCIDEMNGTPFMGKTLEVTMAKAKRKRDFQYNGDRRSSGGGGNYRNSYNSGDGGSRGSYNNNNRSPSGGGYHGGRNGGRGNAGGYGRPHGGGRGDSYYGGVGGPYMAGGGGGQGYFPPQPYPQYYSGGQVYQQPVAGYQVPYGAQPVPQPYHAGGGPAQQQWPQQRQY